MSYANGTNQDQQQPAPQPAEPTVLERGAGHSVIWPQGGAE